MRNMDKEFTIDNEELLYNLLTLAKICGDNGTDNCDLTITTNKGDIICHIEFEGQLKDQENT